MNTYNYNIQIYSFQKTCWYKIVFWMIFQNELILLRCILFHLSINQRNESYWKDFLSIDLPICVGGDGCCNRVLVKATGGAKDDQSLYLGSYKKVSNPYNGRSAYEREGTDKLYIYFFTSEVNG